MTTTVADVMTTDVQAVPETAGFKAIVELIERRRVSALPVVDSENRVVGVVSEADLMLKEEPADVARHHLLESRAHRAERAKAVATTARDLMTAPAVTITRDVPVRVAARRMHREAVKRLPVVDMAGKLVGIVSRSDVLKVFLRDDEQIHRDIVEQVIRGSLMLEPRELTIDVVDGVVSVFGYVTWMTHARMLPRLCASVDGVVSVNSRIEYRYDDEKSRERPGVWTTP